MTSCAAIIVAAGRGNRFGDPLPKQYTQFAGAPLLRHTLAAFDRHPAVDCIIPVIHGEDQSHFESATKGLATLSPVIGGETRQDSVRLGLEALAADPPKTVLIHDGARPVPGAALIDRVVGALQDGVHGVIPILSIPDTLKRVDENEIVRETIPRTGVVRAQTPQGFEFHSILKAHQTYAGEDLTDDAAVFEKAGHHVRTVAGEPANIKVTDKDDLNQLSEILSEVRTGTGFDVHRFEPGDGLVLGGIPIPFERKLAGHSDADVVLHAAADALFGAMADGDIGVHFPQSDPAYSNAPSDTFLRFARDRLQQRMGSLLHLDLTVICEQPKLTPYRQAMRQRIAEIVDVSVERTSVKATTTEGLGFTGRGEGIACQASATIRLITLP